MAHSSALEAALAEIRHNLSIWVRSHDRVVVIALFFSLIPVPPACWVGLFLTCTNLILLKTRRLGESEKKTVLWTLLIAGITSISGTLIITESIAVLSEASLSSILEFLPKFIGEYIKVLAEFILSFTSNNASPDRIAL